jgi:hypothetical protein
MSESGRVRKSGMQLLLVMGASDVFPAVDVDAFLVLGEVDNKIRRAILHSHDYFDRPERESIWHENHRVVWP